MLLNITYINIKLIKMEINFSSSYMNSNYIEIGERINKINKDLQYIKQIGNLRSRSVIDDTHSAYKLRFPLYNIKANNNKVDLVIKPLSEITIKSKENLSIEQKKLINYNEKMNYSHINNSLIKGNTYLNRNNFLKNDKNEEKLLYSLKKIKFEYFKLKLKKTNWVKSNKECLEYKERNNNTKRKKEDEIQYSVKEIYSKSNKNNGYIKNKGKNKYISNIEGEREKNQNSNFSLIKKEYKKDSLQRIPIRLLEKDGILNGDENNKSKSNIFNNSLCFIGKKNIKHDKENLKRRLISIFKDV